MSISEKELPFEVDIKENMQNFEPGFYDQILIKDHMYKKVTPFQIKTAIHNCFSCELSMYHKNTNLSNFDSNIMIIGERPSDIDFETKEGKLLADTLRWAHIDLDDVYLTSLMKCEASNQPNKCQHHLISEILCVQPKVIVALGYEVGIHFDANINSAGYISTILSKYNMITTYKTQYVMTDASIFEDYCRHMLQAKDIYI